MKSRRLIKNLSMVFLAFFMIVCLSTGSAVSKTRISIGTGGSGGVFYVLGAGMAKIINDNSDALQASAQSTAATTENINLTSKSRGLNFAFVVFSSAYDAYAGEGNFKGKQKDDLRLVMYGHLGIMAPITLKKLGITEISQVKGKRLAMSPGSLGKKLSTEAYGGAGLTFDDFSATSVLSYSEMTGALKDGTIDIGMIHAAHPTSSILDIASMKDIVILQQNDSSLGKILERNPTWLPGTIKANTYRGVDYDVKTFATPYAVIASEKVSDKIVYEFIKTIMENNPDLVAIHKAGEFYTKNHIGYTKKPAVPFHPGAEKYLKEIGAIK